VKLNQKKRKMSKFNDLYTSIFEKDEHKKTKSYRKLAPKMKKAVDELFKKLDTKGSNFLNNFEKTITDVSKRYRVPEKQLYDYFENEAMDILK
jgi:hypothetical protein